MIPKSRQNLIRQRRAGLNNFSIPKLDEQIQELVVRRKDTPVGFDLPVEQHTLAIRDIYRRWWRGRWQGGRERHG